MNVPPEDLASVSSLDDPVRRRLYQIISERPGPVGRDEAAEAAEWAARWRSIISTSWSSPGC